MTRARARMSPFSLAKARDRGRRIGRWALQRPRRHVVDVKDNTARPGGQQTPRRHHIAGRRARCRACSRASPSPPHCARANAAQRP
eukprot:scaffold66633_cov40-Tisochrysis_lutea.AAC.2